MGESDKREGGLLLGAGLDYRLSKEISLGLVYDYVRFSVDDQVQLLGGAPAGATNRDINAHSHTISARLTLKLGN